VKQREGEEVGDMREGMRCQRGEKPIGFPVFSRPETVRVTWADGGWLAPVLESEYLAALKGRYWIFREYISAYVTGLCSLSCSFIFPFTSRNTIRV
jgi:hypothetical protein